MKKYFFILIALLSTPFEKLNATHIMGAEIHWKSLGNDTFEISTILYRRCTDGAATMTPGNFTFASDSCSSSYSGTLTNPFEHTTEDITPVCAGTNLPCGSSNTSSNTSMPAGIERHVYKYKLFLGGSYANCCWYKFTWQLCCRASNISTGYADADFTTTSWMNRCLTAGDESPKFNKKPYVFICTGFDNVHDYGGTDADGDSLSYNLAVPGGGSYTSPWSYTYPLTCLGSNNPNPGANPPTGFCFNNVTGQALFRAMQTQCSVFKVEITEWRTISGVKKVIGKTSRDMQVFTIYGCSAVIPTIPGPYVYETCVNHKLCIPITPTISNTTDTVRVTLSASGITGATITYSNDSIRVGSATLCWTPDSNAASSLPYYFVATAKGGHCNSGNILYGVTNKSFTVNVRTNVVSNYSKKRLNCRDYDFIGTINSSSNNTSAKSIRWYINNVQVNGSTKVYPGDSLRYRFRHYGRYAIRMEMDAVGACVETKYDTVLVDTVNRLYLKISNDTAICSTDSVTLSVLYVNNGSTPYKYQWFINNTLIDTHAVIRVSTKLPRWYRCELSTNDSCSDFDADSVLVYPLPYHPKIPDKTFCYGDSAQLLVLDTATNYAYAWYFNGSTYSNQKNILVKDTGRYILKIVAGNCTDYDTVKVSYIAPFSFNLLHDTVVCYPGGTVTLNTANNFSNYTYSWYRADTVFSTLANPVLNDSGVFRVKIVNTTSGCIRYDTLRVDRKPYPTISSPLTNKLFCVNDSVLLTINDTSTTNTYLWKRNGTSISTQKNIYAKLAGSYSLTVTSIWGCSATTYDTVSLYPLPTHTKYFNLNICEGDSIQIPNSDSNSYSFAWYNNGNFISSLKSIYIKNAGTYVQKITNSFGCVLWDSLTLIVNPKPVHTDMGNVIICPGDTAYLINSDTGSYVYSWNKYNYGSGSTYVGNTKSIKVVDSGLYYLQIYTNKGCTLVDSMKVIKLSGIYHTKISNKAICLYDSAFLQNTDTSITSSYQWYFKGNLIATSKSIVVKDSGIYVQRIQNTSGCVKYDTVKVDIRKYIYHTYFPDYTICNGEIVHIVNTDTCIYTGTWYLNGNLFSNNKNVNLTSPGAYVYVMINNVGCALSDTIRLSVLSIPVHTKLYDKQICAGDSVLLQNTDSSSYQFEWIFNGTVISTQQSIYVKNQGIYYQKIKNANGCVLIDSVKLILITRPFHTPLADMYICTGDSEITQNTDSSQYFFYWYSSNGFSSNQRNVYLKTPGTYILRISGSSFCLVYDTIELVLTNKPYHIPVPDLVFCVGDSAYLQNNYVSSNMYQWFFAGNLISTQKNIYTKIPGEYVLRVQSPAGCIMFDTINVYQGNRPAHNKIYNQMVCPNDSVLVLNTDSTQYTFGWYQHGKLISSQQQCYVKDTGLVFHSVTNAFGCSVYDTFMVNHLTYGPKHYQIADQSFCEGDSAWLFNVDSSTYSYTWYYGGNIVSKQRNIYVSVPGEYIVRVGNWSSCSVYDTIEVTKNTKPVFTIAPLNPTVKKGNNITIVAYGTNYSYQWTGSAIFNNWGDSINVKPLLNTNYKVVAYNSSNCKDSILFSVTVDINGVKNIYSSDEISVFPNPVSNELQLIKKEDEPCLITITDHLGKMVFSKNWNTKADTIDVSGFAEGVYLLKVSNSGVNRYYKFIKVNN